MSKNRAGERNSVWFKWVEIGATHYGKERSVAVLNIHPRPPGQTRHKIGSVPIILIPIIPRTKEIDILSLMALS